MADAIGIVSVVLGFVGIALAAKSISVSVRGQRDLADRLGSLDKSIDRRESLVLSHLHRLQGRIDIADASAALWNDERAPRYLAQATWSGHPRFVSIASGLKGYAVTVTGEGQGLMAAVDKYLLKRVMDKQRASQRKFTSAQLIREEDLRELQMGVERYNNEDKAASVDLHTLIGVLNAVLGGTIDSGAAAPSL